MSDREGSIRRQMRDPVISDIPRTAEEMNRASMVSMVPELEASLAQLPPPQRAAPPPPAADAAPGPGAAPAAPTAAPGAAAGLAALLVPADYVDVAALLRMRDRRQRQALLDGLFRGCDLCYRA